VSDDRDPKTRGHPSVFAEVAGAYERARPGYPEDAVRWLAGDEPRDVVDLGAGTGKLTRALVALGHRVMAVEPLPVMLEHLAENAPGAFGVLGTAEVIPLPDAFADVVTCAQSFHWFDHDLALPEIARVLRSPGRLAVVWNIRDDGDAFMARLTEIIGNERLSEAARYGPLEASDVFGPVESAVFRHAQVVDRETLLDLVLSRSHCAKLDQGDRDPVLDAVGRLYDEAAGPGGVRLPYVTHCYRAAKVA
jgi:SAM-dependent methyltransferase